MVEIGSQKFQYRLESWKVKRMFFKFVIVFSPLGVFHAILLAPSFVVEIYPNWKTLLGHAEESGIIV